MKLSSLSKYQLPIFFLLSFAITWTAQITAYLSVSKTEYGLTNEANVIHLLNLFQGKLDPSLLPYFLLFTFAFGPTVAGIIVTALFKGKQGLQELFKQLIRINIPLKWYVYAILIPIGICLTSLALGFVMTGLTPVQFNFLVPLSLIIPFFFYMLIFTGLAEEVGWRGYALPELQEKYSAEKASWILGIAWGLWHLPANLVIPYLTGNLTIPFVVTIVMALTFGIVGWTIVLTWFYNNTKSLFLIIFIHGFMNMLQSYLILSSNNPVAPILYVLVAWIIAVFLLKRYGGKTLMVKN